jgi:hypothetical protein
MGNVVDAGYDLTVGSILGAEKAALWTVLRDMSTP